MSLNSKKKADGVIQKPKLFNLGKATSLEPTWYGMKKLPKKPKTTGTTTKKIITKACIVITCKYDIESPLKTWLPGKANSNLINVAKNVPVIADQKEK